MSNRALAAILIAVGPFLFSFMLVVAEPSFNLKSVKQSPDYFYIENQLEIQKLITNSDQMINRSKQLIETLEKQLAHCRMLVSSIGRKEDSVQ